MTLLALTLKTKTEGNHKRELMFEFGSLNEKFKAKAFDK